MQADAIVSMKARLLPRLRALAEATHDRRAALEAVYHRDAHWRGSHPLNEHSGIEAIARDVWAPMHAAFPDLERRDSIFVGGAFEGRDYVAAVGHYGGTFHAPWLGIPPTGRPVWLRYGEVHQVVDGAVAQSTVLLDVLDLIRQAGLWPLPPSLGLEGMWPGPLTGDGIVLTPQDPAQSAANLAQTLAMHKTLGDYDDAASHGRDGLLDMPQKAHWHPKMMWYGPSGIGTTRCLQGFVDYHQLPFRTAFPRRIGGTQWADRSKGGHYIRIGDGAYSVTGGWPSVAARHVGGGFLGTSPTGRDVTMRVMDFYLHHEGLIRENWVPLDIVHLLLQMDVDILARVRTMAGRP